MARRRPARIVAPLALLAVVAAVFLIVTSTMSDDAGDSSAGGTSTAQTEPAGATAGDEPTKPKRKRKQPKTYTVQSGDILSTVSEQTGVSVEEIQELNPEVDPQALQVGQELKLTPDAETAETTDTP